MTIDRGEINYEGIRLSVNLEKYTPDRLSELWHEAFGAAEKNNIRREKFKNIGGTLKTSDDTVLKGARLMTIDDQSLLTWKNGDIRMNLRINGESSIGIQSHESGEKSVVVVRSSTDRESGAYKQTTRRFTAT